MPAQAPARAQRLVFFMELAGLEPAISGVRGHPSRLDPEGREPGRIDEQVHLDHPPAYDAKGYEGGDAVAEDHDRARPAIDDRRAAVGRHRRPARQHYPRDVVGPTNLGRNHRPADSCVAPEHYVRIENRSKGVQVVAGDDNRASFAFLGTTTGGDFQSQSQFNGVWYLYIATTYDGGQTWSLVNATPIRDDAGQVQLAVNIFHDVTERRQSEE